MTVTSGTHAYVLDRDRQCLAFLLDKLHNCRDKWGELQLPGDRTQLTVEHVRTDPGGARRDDEHHLVAMCHHGNTVEHWGSSTENRALLNAYLLGVTAQGAM